MIINSYFDKIRLRFKLNLFESLIIIKSTRIVNMLNKTLFALSALLGFTEA